MLRLFIRGLRHSAATGCQLMQQGILKDRMQRLVRQNMITFICFPIFLSDQIIAAFDCIDNDVMGKDLEIGVPRKVNIHTEEPKKKILTAGNATDKESEIDCKRSEDPLELNQSEPESEKTRCKSQNKAVDLLGSFAINADAQMESIDFNSPDGLSKAPNVKDKTPYDNKEMPSLELSLKRMRDAQDIEKSAHDRNILRHSNLSAFSK